MGAAAFRAAFERGEPLADVSVSFREGVDGVAATNFINSVAEDFDLHSRPYYDDPRLRIGSATKGALERLFGWRIERVPVMADGSSYMWAEVTRPSRYPPGFEELVADMGLDQPGADDDGQWFEWPPDSAR